MTDGEPTDPEHVEREPAWHEKVLRLNEGFQSSQLPYAFGGAIALNYHREPRSTLDIDLNIFVRPEEEAQVVEALGAIYGLQGQERAVQELQQEGQARTLWGDTFIDLFLANTDFHASMADRVERQPFGDAEIPVLSIEDLLICKVLFDRPKDWIDLEAVAATRRGQLDAGYIEAWLAKFLEPNDPRIERLERLVKSSETN